MTRSSLMLIYLLWLSGVGSFRLLSGLFDGGESLNPKEFSACKMANNIRQQHLMNDTGGGDDETSCHATTNPRVIVVGDVHGSAIGLLDILYGANITSAPNVCEWIEQGPGGTILVQIGDIVDREDQAIEAWRCLEALQSSSPKGSRVVRILGNHELWWLQGLYHMRHPKADTREVVEEIVLDLKAGILDGRQQAAFVLSLGDVDILFIHAGLRPEMLEYLQTKLGNSSAPAIAEHMNSILQEHTRGCPGFGRRCPYDDEIFQAGPDRGGDGIGGPFWTDFSVLERAEMSGSLARHLIQVVGHTVSECYRNYRGNEEHPPVDSIGCQKGLVRRTKNLNAVCVDGGMYLGARTFLQISADGKFVSFEKDIHDLDKDGLTAEYWTRELTDEVCPSSSFHPNESIEIEEAEITVSVGA